MEKKKETKRLKTFKCKICGKDKPLTTENYYIKEGAIKPYCSICKPCYKKKRAPYFKAKAAKLKAERLAVKKLKKTKANNTIDQETIETNITNKVKKVRRKRRVKTQKIDNLPIKDANGNKAILSSKDGKIFTIKRA